MLLTDTEAPAAESVRARRWERLAPAAVLLILAGALVYQAWSLGITVDEPSHLLSSHLYWQGADRLKPRDLPPLIKIVCGWVPGRLSIQLPFDPHDRREARDEWVLSQTMLDRMHRPAIRPLFFFTRLPLIVFPILTAALVWFWGRKLWGARTGLFLMAAYALEPTALGHGALVKNDIAATFTYLLFWFSLWAFWRTPGLWRAAGVGGATLLVLLSKMSMLWLLGVAPLAILARLVLSRTPVRRAALALALVLLIPYLGVLAACQFETRRIPEFELNALRHDPLLPKPLLAAVQIFRVIPMAVPIWEGTLSLFRNNGQPAPVYLLGSVHPEGSLWYFPVALAVKAPPVLLALVLAGLLMLAARTIRRRLDLTVLFWTAPAVLYLGLASLSSLQLGVRLILPALPFGLLIAGAAVKRLIESRKAALAVLAASWLFVQTASVYPNGISYFNELAGGPSNGSRFLSDSNIDWGQSLPELDRYMRSHRIPSVHLAYFGNDIPWRFFRDGEALGVPVPWSEGMVKEKMVRLEPGYYAVSATLLSGQFFPPPQRNYFDPLANRHPVAVIGHSIHLYKVEEDLTPTKSIDGS
jgi:hypothetical protein